MLILRYYYPTIAEKIKRYKHMNTKTTNRLICIGEKIDYVIGVVETAVQELEEEVMKYDKKNNEEGLDDSETSSMKEFQRMLNACGNTLRNLQLAKCAGNSIFGA